MRKISIDSLFFCLEQLPSNVMLEVIDDEETDGLLIVIPKQLAKDIKAELKAGKQDDEEEEDSDIDED